MSLRAFAGLAGTLWYRIIEDGRTDAGAKAGGYTEHWILLHGRAGGGLWYTLSHWFGVFADAGYKLPIFAENQVGLTVSGEGPVRLSPKHRPSPFVRLGLRRRRFVVEAEYQTLHFDRSDAVYFPAADGASAVGLLQPESRSESFTLKVAWTVRF